ncbi:MAG: helix-turn-helix transcriptional regulator, partial [Acidobacteria bacterium]|nr:helix-turn-helix transcriptional regulator [Acidobacteriota bacterium]
SCPRRSLHTSVKIGLRMIKTGQSISSIVTLPFANSATPGFHFEALELSGLFHRIDKNHFHKPRRLAFFQILQLQSGNATEEIDFVQHHLRPGRLSFIRPGQIHRLWLSAQCQGRLLLFEPSFTQAGEHDADHKRIHSLLKSNPAIKAAIDSLCTEYAQVTNHYTSRHIIFHDLQALLLRLQRQSEATPASIAQPSSQKQLFQNFEALLDRVYAEHRSVATLARQLGSSEKTLNRACLAVTGQPPKSLIQQRVTLEAKRILAHTDQPIKVIAATLGFTQATNFVKFFRHATGELPTSFRERLISPTPRSNRLRST